MKNLWHRFVCFIFPWRKINDTMNMYIQKTRKISTLPPANDVKEIERLLREFKRMEKELDNQVYSNKVKQTSNKFNLFIWGVWWFNLGTNVTAIINNTFGWIHYVVIVLAILSIVLYGIMIVRNQRKRNDLFIEGI